MAGTDTDTDTWPTEHQDHPLAHLIPALKVADRCDRCGAQAFMAALIKPTDANPILFCAHHGAHHWPYLQHTATALRDERYRINQAPSASANAL